MKDPSHNDWKIVDWDIINQTKQTNVSFYFISHFQNNIGLILHAVEEYELSMRFLEHGLQLNQR